MIIQIPFSGFYYSIHDSVMDGELEYYPEGIQNRLFDAVNWQAVRLWYAIEYCEQFAHKFDIGLTFESLSSPREYNFTTDRIFAEISADEVQKIFNHTDKGTLARICKVNHTSRDGFISFYDPDYLTWGDVLTWDYNQLGSLLEAYITDHYEFTDFEAGIVETMYSNGFVSNLLWQSTDNPRIFKIADYLRERAERV